MSVKFEDNSAAVLKQFEQNLGRTLEMLGIKQNELAVTEIQRQPKFKDREIVGIGAIDDGHMIGGNSYVTDLPNREVNVGNTVEHAIFVTMGTWKMQKRSWLQNSVLDHADDYRAVVEQGLQQGFK